MRQDASNNNNNSSSNNNSNNNNNPRHLSSPQHQLPESTTHSIYGLKVDPYTLDPGSPFDNNNGLGSGGSDSSGHQRPHTTHVSPPAVVTSTMGRYRKSFNQRKNYDGFIPPGFPGDFNNQVSCFFEHNTLNIPHFFL